jgi:hypothetical protein
MIQNSLPSAVLFYRFDLSLCSSVHNHLLHAAIMRSHERLPIAILVLNTCCERSVIVRDELNDILVL